MAELKIPKGEEPLKCNCEDGGKIEVVPCPNGDIMARCSECERFRKYPAA